MSARFPKAPPRSIGVERAKSLIHLQPSGRSPISLRLLSFHSAGTSPHAFLLAPEDRAHSQRAFFLPLTKSRRLLSQSVRTFRLVNAARNPRADFRQKPSAYAHRRIPVLQRARRHPRFPRR